MVSALAARQSSTSSLPAQLLDEDRQTRAQTTRQYRDFQCVDGNGKNSLLE